jgi:hemoglobin-like flavoprotein
MTPQEITLVRTSFAAVAPIATQAAAIFYDKLFAADPTLRTLFRGDMVAQGGRLMSMIGTAVALLDEPDVLIPELQKLGERHVDYGVQESHYATVGAALIDTLQAGLGDAFTSDVRAAWLAMYGLASSTMIAAARVAP